MKDREEVTQAQCMTRQDETDMASLGMMPVSCFIQYRLGAWAKAVHDA